MDEISLLLYFETCVVDRCGYVDGRRFNVDECKTAIEWADSGFIQWGRVPSEKLRPDRTHTVRLSDDAWEIAHRERRARAERMCPAND